jgi:hypothetical protein
MFFLMDSYSWAGAEVLGPGLVRQRAPESSESFQSFQRAQDSEPWIAAPAQEEESIINNMKIKEIRKIILHSLVFDLIAIFICIVQGFCIR